MSNSSLQPTWYGHVSTARDALVLFEACLNGTLHHVARRPHDRERSQLIKSGYVFIYEENASGIKRWTDGVPWSPSRILGNFLVYRELEKPFPPGEKKRATKRSKRQSRPGEPYPRPDAQSPTSPTTPTSARSTENREEIRNLIGSLVDSYGFKEDGLVKKTMSVNVHGVHHHLVSYYKVEDVLNQTLKSPTADPRLVNLEPRQDLVARQNFRAPLDDVADEHGDGLNGATSHYGYPTGYDTPGRGLMGSYGSYGSVAAMPSYPGLPYSTGAQYQAGMQSYAPMASPGYYGAPQTQQQQHQHQHQQHQHQHQQHQQQQHQHQHHPQSQMKTADDNRQSQLPTPYGYRPQHIHTGSLGQQQLSTPVGASGSVVKLDDPGLNRSQASFYGHTGPLGASNQGTPLHSPTYASSNNGYPYSNTTQQSLPSLNSGGYAQDSSQNYLGLHSPLGAGPRQAYGGPVQGQQ